MKPELEKLMRAERKNRRMLAELRATRQKVVSQVESADRKKLLEMIDQEIAALLK